MKRIRIAVIAMAAVLAAALGIYFAASSYNSKIQKKEEEEANRLIMFDFDENSAESIEIHNEYGDFHISYVDKLGWTLTDQYSFDLDQTVPAAIAAKMSGLTASEVIDANGDISKYGFDDPIKINMTVESGETYSLLVGKVSATRENIYMMKENDDGVYVVPFMTGSVFCIDKNSLKSKSLVNFSITQVESFCLWNGAEKDENILFRISKNENGGWHMSAPFEDDSAYNTDVDTFITDAIHDEAAWFVEEDLKEADYGKYGFDDPSYVFEMSGGGNNVKLIFGSETEDGSGMYVLFANTGQVAAVANGATALLGYNTSDMINTIIYSEAINNVASFDITLPGHTMSVEMNASDKKFVCGGTEIDSSDDDAVSAFTEFYNSFNNAYMSAEKKDETPEGEPVISIKYALYSNVTAIIEYTPVSDDPEDGYYAIKNNQYTGYIVDSEVIDGIIEAYENLEEYLD